MPPPLLVRGSQASLWLAIAIAAVLVIRDSDAEAFDHMNKAKSDSISHVFFVLMPTLKTIWGDVSQSRRYPEKLSERLYVG